jgi:ElaB/YqjD/DUF883 family membrane-anchored ribosome-binding protein
MSRKLKRKSRAEQIASDAWENLVDAMSTAGDLAASWGGQASDVASDLAERAQSRGSDLADKAQRRAGDAAGEAWVRAGNAFDALAGKKARTPWGWVALGVLGGIAIGYAIATAAPKAVSAALDKFGDDFDQADDVYVEPPFTGAEG